MKKYILFFFIIFSFVCAYTTNGICRSKANVTEEDIITATKFQPFYVYEDFGSKRNHFVPSGWIADVADLKLNIACKTTEMLKGKYCIQVDYTPKGHKRWAGIYWQNPANNWATVKAGFDLRKATALTFLAKGKLGNEVISKVQVGGLMGHFPDSDKVWITNIKLTTKWKKYRIDLEDSDLSYISTGFYIGVSKADNPNGATFYLDEIRYE